MKQFADLDQIDSRYFEMPAPGAAGKAEKEDGVGLAPGSVGSLPLQDRVEKIDPVNPVN
jgi:hypothetical protein